mgnify:CR=1 FL=1
MEAEWKGFVEIALIAKAQKQGLYATDIGAD